MVDLTLLRESKAWPVVEALKVIERVEKAPPEKGFVLFETGYGPSGLPHIGTFGEVFRTSWYVRCSICSRTCRAGFMRFRMTWTGFGRCRTICRTRLW